MQDINDYLLWRGDLSFREAGFNKIDSLILTQLSYVNFDDILPDTKSKEFYPLQIASQYYWQKNREEDINKEIKVVRETAKLLRLLTETERFRGLLLGKYINRIDYTEQKQFSAMKVLLPDNSVYIAYRGTDTNLIGWREDFNMAYMPRVPSQTEAVEYLEEVIEPGEKIIRIGGHSKGGNLAVYAAVNTSDEIKKRIAEVYNFDGPGFRTETIKKEEYIRMLPVIQTYIPESSVVGRLLEHQEEYRVVKSSQPRLMQHDAFSWKITGRDFIYAKDLDKSSRLMEAAVKAWIDKLDYKQREQFVNALFRLFDMNHIKTTKDLNEQKLKKLIEIIKAMNEMDTESKKVLISTIRLLGKDARSILRNHYKRGLGEGAAVDTSTDWRKLPIKREISVMETENRSI